MGLVGITGAGAVFGGNGFKGTDMSTDADDLNGGFDRVSPQDPGKGGGAGDLVTGEAGGGSINVSMPSDLQGPHGFNMDCDNQAIITDVNKSATIAASPKFVAFDDKLTTATGTKTGNDMSGDGKVGLNLDDSKPSSDY